MLTSIAAFFIFLTIFLEYKINNKKYKTIKQNKIQIYIFLFESYFCSDNKMVIRVLVVW